MPTRTHTHFRRRHLQNFVGEKGPLCIATLLTMYKEQNLLVNAADFYDHLELNAKSVLF